MKAMMKARTLISRNLTTVKVKERQKKRELGQGRKKLRRKVFVKYVTAIFHLIMLTSQMNLTN